MEMREQIYMLAIDQFGSIKKASEYLHITPPTLSVFLSNLEDATGMKLFDRLGKHFVTTAAGKIYIENAKEMIRLRDRYETQLHELKKENRGQIRFGIHPRRTLYLLAETLAVFFPKHPEIQITACEESSDEMFRLLLDGGLDFIINNRYNPDPSLTYVPFYQDRLVAVISPNHPAITDFLPANGEKIPWLDLSLLSGEQFILPYPVQSVRLSADKAIRYCKAVPGKTFVIENLESGCQLAAEGLGVAFNFESYVKRFTYSKPIRYFYTGNQEETVDYFIIYRKDHYLPGFVVEFIEELKRQLNSI